MSSFSCSLIIMSGDFSDNLSDLTNSEHSFCPRALHYLDVIPSDPPYLDVTPVQSCTLNIAVTSD